MADLTNIENVKKWVKVADTVTTDNELLERLVTAASAFFISTVNRDNLDSVKPYTEKRSGHGGDTLVLRNYPVVDITSLTINGRVIPASPDGIQSGYVFDDRVIELIGFKFDKGKKNVVISYDAGFNDVPADVEQAVTELAGLRYMETTKDRIGVMAEALAGNTVSYNQKDMPESVSSVADKYTNRVPV